MDLAPAGITFDYLREQTVGADATFETPFGQRTMVYCDYTASGRCLTFVENYLQQVHRSYANTHTEDDVTGRSMTHLLQRAEEIIKQSVNAGPDGCIIATGTGASGAINKLQQILGIACPPATKRRFDRAVSDALGEAACAQLQTWQQRHAPVVFVGPYEHHSNEISWRGGYAQVVEVDLTEDGSVDLEHLERLLRAPEFAGRFLVGSFSAASNVTGMRSPVEAIAALLHRYGALACFDYAACAPYEAIDMNPRNSGEGDASIDAIFLSPHKFLGGPGSSGILVFNRRIYAEDLPPTVAAGGTVDYVSPEAEDFIADIETREKAGTPGILQTIRAALAFEVKDALGTRQIAAREHALLTRAMERWGADQNIEILGNPDPARRIGIVSFNVKGSAGRYLHPKLVTALLNDLFGIQSRAGCSCAGPYGHRLLDIGNERSLQYRHIVAAGYAGLKPGWCRVGFHFSMDDIEADYVMEAVSFIGRYGERFVHLYDFDLHSGCWMHRGDKTVPPDLSLAAALRAPPVAKTALPSDVRNRLYRSYLGEAHAQAELFADQQACAWQLPQELAALQYFALDKRAIS
ncbi:MAG: aminotransferase class V-fold PLP-dependent enzyme [Woeseia sp.]